MPDYLLDGEPQTRDVPRNCWGKLLEVVDRDLEDRCRAVSAVRFGGVDQPSFRGDRLAQRHLATLGTIEIATSDAAELLAGTIATARRSIPVLTDNALRLAVEFRGVHPEQASRRLTDVVDALRTLTVLTAAITEVVDVRPTALQAVHDDDVTDAVGDALQALIERQGDQDWTGAADCLEQELAPAIARWHVLFDRLNTQRMVA